MAVTPELLSRFSVLKTLPEPSLLQLASQATLKKFSRREVVVDPGRGEGMLCFLFEGSLQGVDFTVDGREVGLYFVRPGDFCGEVALFGEGDNPEFVIALAKSQVVLLPYSALEPVMYDSRALIQALTRRLARRVSELTTQRSILSLPSIPQRIHRQLWQLTGLTESDLAGITEAEIQYPPTQQEIAIMLNTSRETVTRVFQSLQADQIVQRNGSKSLLVCQPRLLYELAFTSE